MSMAYILIKPRESFGKLWWSVLQKTYVVIHNILIHQILIIGNITERRWNTQQHFDTSNIDWNMIHSIQHVCLHHKPDDNPWSQNWS